MQTYSTPPKEFLSIDKNSSLVIEPEYVLLPEGIKKNTSLVISGSHIQAIGSSGEIATRYQGVKKVALPSRLIMPGFIDAHHHVTQTFGKALAFGEPSEIFKRLWVPLEGFLSEELVYLSSKLAAFESLRGGFTTVADAGTRSQGDLKAIVKAAEETGIRLVLGAICNDGGDDSHKGFTAEQKKILADADMHLASFESHPLITPSLAISIPEVASNEMLQAVYERCKEAHRVFQTHVNEHLVAVERSLIARGLRPLEHLKKANALGPWTLCAHCTLITPYELQLLSQTGASVSYNPVASQWKGNAVAPALQMDSMGIRLGLGTDGTRSDAFRLIDAAEASQRLCYGVPQGDFSCGEGSTWLAMGGAGSADTLGLSSKIGQLKEGFKADFLIVDLDVPEFVPSWDIPWELVRLADRSQIEAVFVDGSLRLWQGQPLDWDAQELLSKVRELVYSIIPKAPIHMVHGTSSEHRMLHHSLLR